MSLNSPPGIHSPKDFANNIPKEIVNLSEQLQNLIMGRIVQVKTATRTRKIVIYVSAADSQGKTRHIVEYNAFNFKIL